MEQDVKRLRIAIQKKGRLAELSLDLIDKAGFRFAPVRGQLLIRLRDYPIDLLLVRDDDIAPFLAKGMCDFGIVGSNVLQEYMLKQGAASAKTVLPLGFARCALKIAIPEGEVYNGVKDLRGGRIATSYPNILSAFLQERDIDAEIVELSGSVEVAPRLQMANAICDLVSTGATLEANGLRAVEMVFESEAVLARTPAVLSAGREDIAAGFLKRVQGVIATQGTKYIMLNAPRDALDEITSILPGAAAPTVMSLAGEEDSVAVHAVCRESVFWETLERLKAAGASAILVLPIEKILM